MSFSNRVFIVILAGLAAVSGVSAQTAQPDQTPAPAAPAAAKQPDYPDSRDLTFGAFYWLASRGGQGSNPDVLNGNGATSNSALANFGNYHDGPGIELSYPVTRTGTLYLDTFEIKGEGNEVDTVTTFPLGVASSFNPGNPLATQFEIKDLRLYLDDLFYPHKFPVSRFRLKTIWGFEYYTIHLTATSQITSPIIADDTRNVFAPNLGMAAEYSLTPHLVARAAISGWGIPHHADIGHGEATLSYRIGHFELVGGEKLLYFKSSPQNVAGYTRGAIIGGFAGIRWHF